MGLWAYAGSRALERRLRVTPAAACSSGGHTARRGAAGACGRAAPHRTCMRVPCCSTTRRTTNTLRLFYLHAPWRPKRAPRALDAPPPRPWHHTHQTKRKHSTLKLVPGALRRRRKPSVCQCLSVLSAGAPLCWSCRVGVRGRLRVAGRAGRRGREHEALGEQRGGEAARRGARRRGAARRALWRARLQCTKLRARRRAAVAVAGGAAAAVGGAAGVVVVAGATAARRRSRRASRGRCRRARRFPWLSLAAASRGAPRPPRCARWASGASPCSTRGDMAWGGGWRRGWQRRGRCRPRRAAKGAAWQQETGHCASTTPVSSFQEQRCVCPIG